jgi:hypothetical protein
MNFPRFSSGRAPAPRRGGGLDGLVDQAINFGF